jgi:hypothetical protein
VPLPTSSKCSNAELPKLGLVEEDVASAWEETATNPT